METNELIEHLRIMGRTDDRNPNYYLLAADRLEELAETKNRVIGVIKEYAKAAVDAGRESLDPVDDIVEILSVIDALATSEAEPEVVGEWEWNPNGMDWGLGAWVCSECRCKNDNLPMDETIKPLLWAGAKYCPQCGIKMRK